MNKTDCFAYTNYSCTALKKKECKNCKFYKSKEQYEKELKLHNIRR